MAAKDGEGGGTLMTVVKAVTAVAVMITAVFGVFKLFVSDEGPVTSPVSSSASSTIVTPNVDIGPASIFLNRDSGPGGTTVKVSGEGFGPGERVTFRFHVEQVGTTKANAEGKFSNVSLTIPSTLSRFAPQQFNLSATGNASLKNALAPFQLTG
jgi:hypothetical protein